MKKIKQLLAILGVIILAGLYVTTLVMAIIDNSSTQTLFKTSVVATILIPTLIWIYSYIYKLIKKNNDEKKEEH